MITTATNGTGQTLQGISVDLMDRIGDAADLVGGLHRSLDEADMSPAIAQLWHAAQCLANEHCLLEEQHTLPVRVAQVLSLNALIASPEAVMAALERLRAELVRLDPTLAPIAR